MNTTYYEMKPVPVPHTLDGRRVLNRLDDERVFVFDTRTGARGVEAMSEHDCGVYCVVGQAHVCADVRLHDADPRPGFPARRFS